MTDEQLLSLFSDNTELLENFKKLEPVNQTILMVIITLQFSNPGFIVEHLGYTIEDYNAAVDVLVDGKFLVESVPNAPTTETIN